MTVKSFLHGLKQFSIWHDKKIIFYTYASWSRKSWKAHQLTPELVAELNNYPIEDITIENNELRVFVDHIIK